MLEYFNEDTVLKALRYYTNHYDVLKFSYEGMMGVEAFYFYCATHPAFEVEVTCAYLDIILFGESDFPNLPVSV